MRLRPALQALRRGHRPVLLGSLGSTEPISLAWGADRGLPIDRWYIECFLAEHRADVTGRVLEVKDSGYTDRFGHDVTERGVLDVDETNERATYLADLALGDGLADAAFDCFVLTQTLQYVFDLRAAFATMHRVLRPGGVLLATVPVASRVTDPPLDDLWRFTPLALERLLVGAFGAGEVSVSGRGNVLAQVAFLKGLATEDLTERELAADDPRFPLVACARAVKAG